MSNISRESCMVELLLQPDRFARVHMARRDRSGVWRGEMPGPAHLLGTEMGQGPAA